MKRKYYMTLLVAVITALLTAILLPGCSSPDTSGTSGTSNTTVSSNTTSTSPPGVGHTVVLSDSFITGKIQSIEKQTTGYPWKLSVMVMISDSVNNLPNPTIDQVGKEMTAVTDEDVSSLSADQVILAHVKYAGDVPQPGISLYIYDIKPVSPSETSNLDQEFTLGIAQSAVISGENMTVTFADITSDSRCPRDATCIWAGEVTASVTVTQNHQSSDMVLVQPGLSNQNAVQDFGNYQLLFSVEPAPSTGKEIAKEDYRLVMTVTRAAPEPKIAISPAPIDDVQIAGTFSNPRQIIVWIKGGLPDTCTSFSDMNMERNGNTIAIKVNVQKETNQICGYVYSFFEKCMNLGSDFTSGETYTVMVNDTSTTFTMP